MSTANDNAPSPAPDVPPHVLPQGQPAGSHDDTHIFRQQSGQSHPQVVATFRRHRLLRTAGGNLARGHGSRVPRAQPALDRCVAVKVILDGSFAPDDQVRRFATEARAVANLKHPNIVAIYEYGESGGQPYLVMEYIAGQNPTNWRNAQTSYDERALIKLTRSIALAFGYAHKHGVIHRDLKPSNVLVDRQDVPHVVDFGLAKLAKNDSSLTAAGVVIGTPSYMAHRAGSGRSIANWSSGRRIWLGRNSVRAVNGPATLSSGNAGWHIAPSANEIAGAAPILESGRIARVGGYLPEMFGKKIPPIGIPVRAIWPPI